MNPHASTQKKEGRGPVGKQAVVGMESRKKTHVKAQVVSTARATTLHHVMNETTEKRVDVSGVDGVTSPVFSHREAGVQFYHADCLKLMGSLTERYPNGVFDMIFADPPYFLSNGGISCHAGKRVSVNKGAWDKSNGTEQNHTFNLAWLSLCQRLLKPNGTLWVSGTHHVIYSIGYAIQQCGMKILNEIAWEKPNPPPNLSCRYFTHSVELILWAAKSPKSKHVFNYQEMRQRNGGKQMKTVWSIPAPQQWEKRHGKHPTQKPVDLLDRIILASTHPDALIFDPFAGSATTGVSAIRTGRKFLGCDVDSTFIELSRARLDEAFQAQASQLRSG